MIQTPVISSCLPTAVSRQTWVSRFPFHSRNPVHRQIPEEKGVDSFIIMALQRAVIQLCSLVYLLTCLVAWLLAQRVWRRVGNTVDENSYVFSLI